MLEDALNMGVFKHFSLCLGCDCLFSDTKNSFNQQRQSRNRNCAREQGGMIIRRHPCDER